LTGWTRGGYVILRSAFVVCFIRLEIVIAAACGAAVMESL